MIGFSSFDKNNISTFMYEDQWAFEDSWKRMAGLKFVSQGAISLWNTLIKPIKYEYDLESFFKYYKIINVKALSERIGMNQSLLSQ